MTKKDIANIIKEMADTLKCPFAYQSFRLADNVKPPFLIYYYPNSADFMADDVNYVDNTALNIEFYSDEKDFESEEKIQAILKKYGMAYERNEAYISGEHMFQILFQMEVITNG